MAKDNLEDCWFNNSNPPLDETQDDDNPFGDDWPELDPCLTYTLDVIIRENNVNAAWDYFQGLVLRHAGSQSLGAGAPPSKLFPLT